MGSETLRERMERAKQTPWYKNPVYIVLYIILLLLLAALLFVWIQQPPPGELAWRG